MMLRTLTVATAAALVIVGHASTISAIRTEMLQQPQQPGEVALTIRGAAGARPRLGIPDFTVVGAPPELQAAVKTIADVLWDDLEFEDEYSMIKRTDSAKVPVTDSIDAIRYDLWRELGADAIVLGTARQAGAGLEIEIRLVGTSRDQSRMQVFGKKYAGGCSVQTARFCAHYIADDLHKDQRRLDGVARTHLAFSSDRNNDRVPGRIADNASQEIYMSDYDGGNQQRLTANRSLNLSPTWSPDGRSIAYSSYMSHFPDIYVQTVFEVGRPTRPAAGSSAAQNQMPAFSPDGKKIAFSSTQDGAVFNIFVVNRDGSDLRRLTNTKNIGDVAPTWSPNGNQIAFVSGRSGDAQLYVMNSDGTAVERLPCGETQCDHPTWSPVLNKLAYTCGSPAAGFEICLMDMQTRQVTKLTDGPGTNEQPSFAPNGRHVVFVTTRWGKSQLAIVDLKGTLKRRITELGNNKFPNWSR